MWSTQSVNQSQSGPMKISCASNEGYISQGYTGSVVGLHLETWKVVSIIVYVSEECGELLLVAVASVDGLHSPL